MARTQKSICTHNVKKKTFNFFKLSFSRVTHDSKVKSFMIINQMSSYVSYEYKYELKLGSFRFHSALPGGGKVPRRGTCRAGLSLGQSRQDPRVGEKGLVP